jgi:ZIP family zinc transporter
MDLWQVILVRLGAAIFMAGLGSFIAISFKKVSHFGLCLLISFAAGALLAVAMLDLIPETIEAAGWLGGTLSIASGYVFFALISRFIFHVCPACSATHTEVNFKAITISMLVALSIHSFMDGLAIYSGYLATGDVGVLILLAVAFHKLPEGLALTLVARGSGLGRLKAFLFSVTLESVTTLAGGLAGFFVLVSHSDRWVGYVLGHIAGSFIFLVIHALLSEVFKHHPRSTVVAALAGALSMAAAGYMVGAF